MSFRPEYLAHLYGSRRNLEHEMMSDDDSSSSESAEPWTDSTSSTGSAEPWTDGSDSEEETWPPNPPQNRHIPHSGGAIDCTRNSYGSSKNWPNDDAGLIFLTDRPNPTGCVRTEEFTSRKKYDMFAWLSSKHRKFPKLSQSAEETLSAIGGGITDIATKYKNLRLTANLHVGVYRSKIHGRGLFSLVDIDPGEMVIEFVGEVIRSGVSDMREKHYREKGIGSHVLKIDEDFVVDGTMKGNVARFINHSCEPNCHSEIIDILGKQRVIIVARSRIRALEEITCDCKCPSEEEKISCRCEWSGCRKF